MREVNESFLSTSLVLRPKTNPPNKKSNIPLENALWMKIFYKNTLGLTISQAVADLEVLLVGGTLITNSFR